jgi:hypothetical protein
VATMETEEWELCSSRNCSVFEFCVAAELHGASSSDATLTLVCGTPDRVIVHTLICYTTFCTTNIFLGQGIRWPFIQQLSMLIKSNKNKLVNININISLLLIFILFY